MFSKQNTQVIGKSLLFLGKAYSKLTCFALGGLFFYAGIYSFPVVTLTSVICLLIGTSILYSLVDPFGVYK